MIRECDGLDKIEDLLLHENKNVFQMASFIIVRYFPA